VSDRLAEIRARLDAATPGPWGWNSYNGVYSGPLIQADARLEAEHEAAGAPWDEDGEPSGEWRSRFADVAPRVCSVPPSYGDTATGRHAADAQFIAHARADIPWLLEQLAAQTARLTALERACYQEVPEGGPHTFSGFGCLLCGWDCSPEFTEMHEPSCLLYAQAGGEVGA
jgi:hypothetical protein